MDLVFDAVLLAAGRSQRMGTDKALLPSGTDRVASERLWERQWRVLDEAGVNRRWLSVRAEQAWVPTGIARLADDPPEAGPLGGILKAWEASDASHLIVLAVDLPALPPIWLQHLKTLCAPGRGAVGRHAGSDGQPERFEPLAAIYPRQWRPAWARALAEGRGSLQHLLRTQVRDVPASLALRTITSAETGWFRNVNTPADLTPPRAAT